MADIGTKEKIEINTCPKCGKTYDDSWGQCINCAVPLVKNMVEVEPLRKPESGEIVCPNRVCRYVGKPKKERKRSTGIASLMFFMGILPGIFYLCFTEGYNYVCPKCGRKIDVESLIA
ncbi:MAG: hypothetical protein WBB84_03500 [Candidatus Omnitrophota bacterium]